MVIKILVTLRPYHFGEVCNNFAKCNVFSMLHILEMFPSLKKNASYCDRFKIQTITKKVKNILEE